MAKVDFAGNGGKFISVSLGINEVRFLKWAAMSRCQHDNQSSIDFCESFTYQDDAFAGNRLLCFSGSLFVGQFWDD